MDGQNDESTLVHKSFDRVKREHLNGNTIVTLRDMPLETRRKEAQKPLFLIRYE